MTHPETKRTVARAGLALLTTILLFAAAISVAAAQVPAEPPDDAPAFVGGPGGPGSGAAVTAG